MDLKMRYPLSCSYMVTRALVLASINLRNLSLSDDLSSRWTVASASVRILVTSSWRTLYLGHTFSLLLTIEHQFFCYYVWMLGLWGRGTVFLLHFLSGGLEVPWMLMWLVSEYGSVLFGRQVGFAEGLLSDPSAVFECSWTVVAADVCSVGVAARSDVYACPWPPWRSVFRCSAG